MNGIHLAAREVQDEEVKTWIAAWASEAEREGLQDDHRRALQGALTNFANVLEKNLSTPGAKGDQFTSAFRASRGLRSATIPLITRIPRISRILKIIIVVTRIRVQVVTTDSYYDECGDRFDPDNGANWDGDQQVGFRD